MIKVAVDAMGGDNAPVEMVAGAVEAVKIRPEIHVLLVGQEKVIEAELSKYTFDKERIHVVNASEIIATEEPPVNAIRKKKDSSIVVGMNLVKSGEADAFVSAGSSGAVLVGGQVIVGRIKGVERPPLASLIPTENGVSLLIDCGANVDARSVSSGSVCPDGFYLYGARGGSKAAKGRHRQYRCRGRKGQCPGKRDLPLIKRMQRPSISPAALRQERFPTEAQT